MTLLGDAIISVPLGILYDIFCQKLSDIVFASYGPEEKYQNSLTLMFLLGILGIIIAQTLITKNGYKYRVTRQGLVIGGIILIIYSSLINWDKMTDYTKLFVIGIAIGALLIYSFWYFDVEETEPKKSKKITKKNSEELLDELTEEMEEDE
jgi:hypothetical protein